MLVGVQTYSTLFDKMIRMAYYIKLKRLTSIPNWQRRMQFAKILILRFIRNFVCCTLMVTKAEFSCSGTNSRVTGLFEYIYIYIYIYI